MTKFFLATAIAAAIGLPSTAMAQAAPNTGSVVCRPATAGETSDANTQNTAPRCKTLNVDSTRDATRAAQTDTTPDQKAMKQATKNVLPGESLFIPYPGFDGNPND
jgi:hypothetical protein